MYFTYPWVNVKNKTMITRYYKTVMYNNDNLFIMKTYFKIITTLSDEKKLGIY